MLWSQGENSLQDLQMLQSLREETEGQLQMPVSLRKNGLTSQGVENRCSLISVPLALRVQFRSFLEYIFYFLVWFWRECAQKITIAEIRCIFKSRSAKWRALPETSHENCRKNRRKSTAIFGARNENRSLSAFSQSQRYRDAKILTRISELLSFLSL